MRVRSRPMKARCPLPEESNQCHARMRDYTVSYLHLKPLGSNVPSGLL